MTEEDKNDKYIICSKCRSKCINDKEHINNVFGYTRLEMRYKTCVKCRDYDKKRNKLQTEKAEAALRGLKYCDECKKAKPRDKFVMPNGNSYDQCRCCLIHGSDDEDDSKSSYSDQCVYDAGDYEVGFSNM